MSAQDAPLATAFALAARAMRYPDEAFAQAVASGTFQIAWERALVFCGFDPREVRAPDLHELRVEATGLFYGMPRAAVSPYESQWIARDEGRKALLFVDDVALDAKRAYRDAGLEPADASQPCDHVATELEFAAQLLSRGEVGTASEFARRHLRWIAEFAAAVERECPGGFYAALCGPLPQLVETLA